MTDPNFTYLANIIDRSGSMASIRTDAEGGFNAFIDDQRKAPGRCTVFSAHFNNNYEVVHPHMDLALVGSYTLPPGGGTALLDAIGRTIDEVGARLAGMSEEARPGHVVVTITTDGEENASRSFTRNQIFEKITHQRDTFGWEFVFLAANQDAISTGAALGIPRSHTLSFAATGQGVGSSYSSLSSHVTSTRSGHAAAFTDAERDAAIDPAHTTTP